ncbi:MAG TPA: protein-L-isoaspartate(D-aspartate) O-methyltransferase [Bacteroidia bacterium]|nr:protein-L-isoaspartate(D-aspartate) O-methyltransferase [Bacteroidia bacterium]HNU33014.1 protein-L-isoaspartate(D-aspartate) O-methyltransferase [Bacteroidia bacterium]
MIFNDTFKHHGKRKLLVEELKRKLITDLHVLDAIEFIPRHFFMDNAFTEYAYQDKAFPIEAGQTISQPYTVAFQTQLLEIKKGEKVLEIGTGSGYQTSVLCKMGARVFSIERHKVLNSRAQKVLSHLNMHPKLFFGDGFMGLETHAPYDKIIVTCGAPFIPQELVKQLKTYGKMVVPVGSDVQVMKLVYKQNDTDIQVVDHDKFKFVPMLENKVP